MPPSNPIPALEALLFSSDQPLTLALLAESIELEPEVVEASLRELGEAYAERGAGVELREIAGGWMLVTTPAQAEWVGRMLRGKRKMRLSRAGLACLVVGAQLLERLAHALGGRVECLREQRQRERLVGREQQRFNGRAQVYRWHRGPPFLGGAAGSGCRRSSPPGHR